MFSHDIWAQKFIWTQITFLNRKRFWTHNVLTKFLLIKIFLSKKSLGPKFFWDPNFFEPKIILDHTFLGPFFFYQIFILDRFLEAVASLGLVVSLSLSVSQVLAKLENVLCKSEYKWIQKAIIVTKRIIGLLNTVNQSGSQLLASQSDGIPPLWNAMRSGFTTNY